MLPTLCAVSFLLCPSAGSWAEESWQQKLSCFEFAWGWHFGVCGYGRDGWRQQVGLFFFSLKSLNNLSASQASSLWANLLAITKLYCIIQPGNTHLLLLEVVGSRNHIELVERSWKEFPTLCDETGEITIKTRWSICKALDSQVIDQPRLYHCMPTCFDLIYTCFVLSLRSRGRQFQTFFKEIRKC